MSSTVAIVGRPNVGKSTFFNRLIGKRKAIVDDMSGVTRDRQYDYADWNGFEFLVVDTGGYVENSDDIFEREIRKQVDFAITESQLILFLVDVNVGITDQDEAFARYLRKKSKKVLLIVNKVDNNARRNEMYEFYSLGFEHVYPVSSINGSGTGEMLDHLVEILRSEDAESSLELPDLPKFCVVGKPNVGKSTLVNALLQEDRNIVSDIPGTTRDSIHSVYNKFGKQFILIDTSGLRKKTKVHENIEFYSTIRSVQSIEESDVVFLMIDAREGIQAQDMNILGTIIRRNKGVVILLNKWDLVDKKTNTEKNLFEEVRSRLAPFNDIPILTISAKDKTRLLKALETALEVYDNLKKKISTSVLNNYMLPIIEGYHPPSVKGKIIKIKYVTQIQASFPLFAFYCNNPQYMKDSYKRFLENKLREKFNFSGIPIRLSFRQK